jgi:hypothetical protein
MISFRFSLSVVIFFILAIFHVTLPLCFAITTCCEIIMVIFLVYTLDQKESTPNSLWFDILAIQYVERNEVNLTEMIHTCGARTLAMLLGFFAIGFYIPTIIIYLLTLIDIVKKKGAN